MLLDRTLERNPALVEAAIRLHQDGAIPAGSFLLDLDAIEHNASLLAESAGRHGLRTYLMTKSYGRHPYVTALALACGLDSTVAVEAREAHLIHRFDLPVGHVGHIGAVPLAEAPRIVAMEPELVTVFTVEAAAAIARAAAAQGREQQLLVRVNDADDEVFRGFVGGWTLDGCVEGIAPILALDGVRVVGVTSYPTISYTTVRRDALALNRTFETLLRARERLERELGLDGLRVNAPANNGCATFGLLADGGATDVEPGHALLGGSLLHALDELPELPAQVYVSEVTHRWAGELYTLGSGLQYVETFGGVLEQQPRCLVGSTFERARSQPTRLVYRGHVDYYAVCEDVPAAQVGDTAIYALHPQYFVNRAYVAAVSGVSRGTPQLRGLFDWAATELDEQLAPVAAAETAAACRELSRRAH